MSDAKNRAENLRKFRGNAREKGQQNRDEVLAWLYKWGWSTDAALSRLLDVLRPVGGELARKGVLLRVEPPRGHKPAYVIAPAYQSKALKLHEDRGGEAIPYPWPRSAVPFASLGEHNEVAQLKAIDVLRSMEDESVMLITDRELRGSAKTGEAIPDFLIRTGDFEEVFDKNGVRSGFIGGECVWYEVELTGKRNEKLAHQLYSRHKALKRGEFSRIEFFCASDGVANNLMRALHCDVLRKTARRADGRLVEVLSEAGWSPDLLRRSTEIWSPSGPPIWS